MFFDGDKVRATVEGYRYEIDLGEVYRLEARQSEIQGVGIFGARELMKAMQDGRKKVGELLAITRLQLNRIDTQLKIRTAIVYNDEIPKIMKELGASSARSPNGAADTRKSLLWKDKGWQDLQDFYYQVEAIVSLLVVKADSFRDSYFTVNKAYEERGLGAPQESVANTQYLEVQSPVDGHRRAAAPAGTQPVSVDAGPSPGGAGLNSNPQRGILIGKAKY